MKTVYINYPTPEITVRNGSSSAHIQKHGKINQRFVKIDSNTLLSELRKFQSKAYRFASTSKGGLNDMWLSIDLNDPQKELAVIQQIQGFIGSFYSRLSATRISISHL